MQLASNEAKIKYLRKKGMKIGDDCQINTLLFSEPFLVEIGNHVAIAGGTEFITHDGAIWCFRDEIKDGDIYGKIKWEIMSLSAIIAFYSPILRLEITASSE